ncbi:hypothetical protein QFZ63_002669 [Streptomyces sp. B3I7]|uniref:hypothetical protein n=1 Tax=Streptomyces sp. B3I7 TaxID=3042269 RepID=UPI00278552FB|nr:hypothetical protein [Streptomyces sp. B3I7]MDQ0810955.1 hypothetical protein [Streptomyces sp. B3I7]
MALWDDIERSLVAWQDAGSPEITVVRLRITAEAHTYRTEGDPSLRWQHRIG